MLAGCEKPGDLGSTVPPVHPPCYPIRHHLKHPAVVGLGILPDVWVDMLKPLLNHHFNSCFGDNLLKIGRLAAGHLHASATHRRATAHDTGKAPFRRKLDIFVGGWPDG